MKRWSIVSAVLFLVGLGAFSYTPQASGQAGAGWVTLFDGKNLDNFNKVGDANWRIEDGVVVADKGNGFLVTKNSYTDYQIRAEFWVDTDANSGIFIRCTDPDKIGSRQCLRSEHLGYPSRSDLRHRRDRQPRQGRSDAESRRQMERLRDHREGLLPSR